MYVSKHILSNTSELFFSVHYKLCFKYYFWIWGNAYNLRLRLKLYTDNYCNYSIIQIVLQPIGMNIFMPDFSFSLAPCWVTVSAVSPQSSPGISGKPLGKSHVHSSPTASRLLLVAPCPEQPAEIFSASQTSSIAKCDLKYFALLGFGTWTKLKYSLTVHGELMLPDFY